jgi:hypothetical protein
MYVFHQIVIIIAAITAAIEGSKKIILTSHPLWLWLSVINFIAEVITQVFVVYKFPLLFVSLIIIKDPLFQHIMKKIYTKFIKNKNNKKLLN